MLYLFKGEGGWGGATFLCHNLPLSSWSMYVCTYMMEPFYDETFFRLRVINGMLVSFFSLPLFPFFPTSELVIIQTTLYPPQKFGEEEK